MNHATLVRMANQIATFYKPYSEAEAIVQTEGHIKRFWDPRMKKDLQLVVEAGGEGLSPTAMAAAQRVVGTA